MKSVVTVGNFDGVHVGHQKIIREVRAIASPRGYRSLLITFDPHPAMVVSNVRPEMLTTLRERTELAKEFGIEEIVVLPFTNKTAAMSAEEFLRKLCDDFEMNVLCLGPNTQVGHRREGTPEKIAKLSGSMGFELVVVSPVVMDGQTVSSSRVRSLVRQGNVSAAKALLGRWHGTEGRIVKGASRGTKLGFPTANLEPVDTLLPADGVYSTFVYVHGAKHLAVTNVGKRPTFGENPLRSVVEAHLFEFTGDLLGSTVRVEWISQIRPEVRFSSAEALRDQIQVDCQTAKEQLSIYAQLK